MYRLPHSARQSALENPAVTRNRPDQAGSATVSVEMRTRFEVDSIVSINAENWLHAN